jgi:hypothetical protein
MRQLISYDAACASYAFSLILYSCHGPQLEGQLLQLRWYVRVRGAMEGGGAFNGMERA